MGFRLSPWVCYPQDFIDCCFNPQMPPFHFHLFNQRPLRPMRLCSLRLQVLHCKLLIKYQDGKTLDLATGFYCIAGLGLIEILGEMSWASFSLLPSPLKIMYELQIPIIVFAFLREKLVVSHRHSQKKCFCLLTEKREPVRVATLPCEIVTRLGVMLKHLQSYALRPFYSYHTTW